MLTLDSIAAARTAITTFLINHGASLAETDRAKVMEFAASPSPVDQIVNTAEFLYARHADLNNEGRELVGGLASFCAINGWHGMADDNRGGQIAQAMARENGEKAPGNSKWPTADKDPEAKPQFVPPPVVESPEDGVTPSTPTPPSAPAE